MFDLFAAMPPEVCRAQMDDYRAYLRERDGSMDVQRRTLSRREESIGRFESTPKKVRDMDRELFSSQYARYDSKRKTPDELLLLLGMTKINAAEAYGVNAAIGKAMEKALISNDEVELNLMIEETYHTRILLSSARLYGIAVDHPFTPPSSLRILISSVVHTPELFARPITLCGEILAVMMFSRMLHAAQKLLAHDPELRDTISERIVEVLVDEIGHISFNRMLMSAAALARTRLIFPMVARGILNIIPELRVLDIMPENATSELGMFGKPSGFPDFVKRQAFFA